MKKLLVLAIALCILLGIGFFIFMNPKDSWICQGGEWIRKGSPKTSQPTTPCAGTATKPKLPSIPPESSLVSFYTWLVKEDLAALEKTDSSPYLSTTYKKDLKNIRTPESNPFICLPEPLTTIKITNVKLEGTNAQVKFEQQFQDKTASAQAQITAVNDTWEIEKITCNES